MAENTNKMPLKQWRKWSPCAREVFNNLYSYTINNQQHMTHPKQTLLPQEQWRTICWNMAWIAADSTQQELKLLLVG